MRKLSVAVGILSGMLGSLACAQQELQRTFATRDGNLYGWSVTEMGDLDKDGYPDTAIGGWMKRGFEESGQVVVVSGSDGSTLFTFTQRAPVGRYGWCVANVGDIDGDKHNDILVGCPLWGIGAKFEAGRVDLYSGKDGTIVYTLFGAGGDQFGWAADGIGDLNGDGYADFAVGSPGFDNGRGRVVVYSGLDRSVLFRKAGTPAAALGRSVSGLGDVDKDGLPDLIVGAPLDHTGGIEAGRALILCGANGAVLYRITGDTFGDHLGTAVSRAGDLDHDGYADFIIGIPFEDNSITDVGCVRVYGGADGKLLAEVWGDLAGDQFGAAVSAARDFNGDGHLDFIVGAPMSDANGLDSGMARVFSGRTFASLYTFVGNGAGDQFGFAVSTAGDLNLDGYADVLIGAPFDGTAPAGTLELPDPGQAFVYGGFGLFLKTDNLHPSAGETLTLTTLEGEPALPTLMLAVSVSGVPIALPIGGLAYFDTTGKRDFPVVVPTGLAGIEIEMMAFALNGVGKVDATLPNTILFD